MKSSKKSFNKGLIVLNKGERIAVISLLSIIAIFLGISVFRPEIKLSKKERMAFHNLDSMIAVQEKALKEQQEKVAVSENKTVSEPISKPTSSSPSYSKNTVKESKPKPKPESKSIPILDINIADSTALIDLPQIGQVMASRIHRYRNRLGGFVSMTQLFEIKGMDQDRFESIKPYIVLEHSEITKINVNQDEFKTLLRHPYLEYEQVKAIVNHREKKGFINNWEQLQGIVGDVNPLLESYVSF